MRCKQQPMAWFLSLMLVMLPMLPAQAAMVDNGRIISEQQGALDSAAILSTVDLVVTSDTALAHLAGALGVPVWLALSHAPDWRWGLTGEDCAWYPTMRLFRQPEKGNWDAVLQRVAKELEVLVSSP